MLESSYEAPSNMKFDSINLNQQDELRRKSHTSMLYFPFLPDVPTSSGFPDNTNSNSCLALSILP